MRPGGSATIPTSYPFMYLFLTEKVPFSCTFFLANDGPLLYTWFRTLHQKTHKKTHTHTQETKTEIPPEH